MTKAEKIIQGMQMASLPGSYWITPNVELPELNESQSIIQKDGLSVFTHTLLVIDLLTIKNPITLWSGLFHDLGKVRVHLSSPVDDMSKSRFPGHAAESANIAKIRLTEWEATPYVIDRVCRLVSMHMFDISNAIREKTIRKFVADVGQDNVDNWFVLRIADSRCYGARHIYYSHFIKPFRKLVTSYLERQPQSSQPEIENPDETGAVQIEGENAL